MSHAEATSLEYTSTGQPNARVALWWFLASEIAIFGGAVVCYILLRQRHPEWGAEAAHTLTWAGGVNTVVLLTSSLAAVLADHAAETNDHRRAARLLWATIAGGLVFLAIKGFEYTHEISHGFTPVKSLFWSFYFLMTGLHGLHVLAGMVAMGIVAAAAARGERVGRVAIAALYWHFVDVVWIFLFPLLYIAS